MCSINFVLIWSNLSEQTSTNVNKLFGFSIIAYILAGVILAALLSAILFIIVRALTKTSYAEFRRIDTIAQLPYVLFFFFSILFMTGEIEGNIMGFIFFPAYIILTLITVPISFALSIILIRRARN